MEYNYYEILGLRSDATKEEIKTSFKMHAKKYHPDKNPDNKFYEEHFKKINVAYQILSNDAKRSNYDFILKYQAVPGKEKTTADKNRSEQSYKSRPNTAKPASQNLKSRKGSDIKNYTILLAGLAGLIVFAIFFFDYMNHYTAEKHYLEGLELERNKLYIPALESYAQAMGYDKTYASPYARSAYLKDKILGNYQGAFYDYSKAILYSQQPGYNLYFGRAENNLKLKKYNYALMDLQQVSTLKPDFDSAWFYMGEINYYILKNYPKAIENYSFALSLNKSLTDAYLGRALCKQELGKHIESLPDFDNLIMLEPADGQYNYYKSFSRRALKDYAGACKDLIIAYEKGFKQAKEARRRYCK